MIQTLVIAFHLIVVLALIGVVLLQKSEGGALGMGGGGGGFMTGRGQANALTRATAVLAALFFATSLALTIMANVGRAPKSILDGATPVQQQGAPGAPAAPGATPAAPPSGGLLDQLKQIEDQKQQQQTPAVPAAPAAPEPPRQ